MILEGISRGYDSQCKTPSLVEGGGENYPGSADATMRSSSDSHHTQESDGCLTLSEELYLVKGQVATRTADRDACLIVIEALAFSGNPDPKVLAEALAVVQGLINQNRPLSLGMDIASNIIVSLKSDSQQTSSRESSRIRTFESS